MPIDPGCIGRVTQPEVRSWTSDDGLLYALAVGSGTEELPFTTENTTGTEQALLPTMAATLGAIVQPVWDIIGPFDRAALVHGEQAISIAEPIPVAGSASVASRVAGLYDKGKAAVVVIDTDATDTHTGTLRFTSRTSVFIRGEGGWGGERGPSPKCPAPPDRMPDHVVTEPTLPIQALLYRLTGDRNPLHSDPVFAAKAGFERPILHGLCTFGFAGRALLNRLCGGDPARFTEMSARFVAPAYPGDELTTAIWVTGRGEALYQTARAADAVVLDGGVFRFQALGRTTTTEDRP
ncbi:MAG TPA: MaoC/PaaZ C-terminal domain-containing protein [Acidimicrobiia bacterium]|jgi:acyl dehydratase|nr:MaoC/PaaZ C-terminal domain-containing protein [Acidimicrobiia bacterium]